MRRFGFYRFVLALRGRRESEVPSPNQCACHSPSSRRQAAGCPSISHCHWPVGTGHARTVGGGRPCGIGFPASISVVAQMWALWLGRTIKEGFSSSMASTASVSRLTACTHARTQRCARPSSRLSSAPGHQRTAQRPRTQQSRIERENHHSRGRGQQELQLPIYRVWCVPCRDRRAVRPCHWRWYWPSSVVQVASESDYSGRFTVPGGESTI